jgi:integrase
MRTTRKTETAPISWNQAQTLIKALVSDADYNTALLFASGFYFGLRISDILSLTWGQILSPSFEITEQKTGKRREITVHRQFRKLVKEITARVGYPHEKDFVFTAQRRGMRKDRPISVIAANKRIKKAFDQYGIDAQNPSSHTLRKTFGRRVYENNNQSEAALILLSKIFNHRDTATTRRYIGITQEQISNAYLSL